MFSPTPDTSGGGRGGLRENLAGKDQRGRGCGTGEVLGGDQAWRDRFQGDRGKRSQNFLPDKGFVVRWCDQKVHGMRDLDTGMTSGARRYGTGIPGKPRGQ